MKSKINRERLLKGLRNAALHAPAREDIRARVAYFQGYMEDSCDDELVMALESLLCGLERGIEHVA